MPGTPTTRLGLATIDGADDAVSSYPTVNNDNMDVLDNAGRFFSGTLANRGSVIASPVKGDRYYATDIPGEYLYDGTTWQPILVCAVTSLPSPTGVSRQPNASRPTFVNATVTSGGTDSWTRIQISPTGAGGSWISMGLIDPIASSSGVDVALATPVPPGWYYLITLANGAVLTSVVETTL